VAELERFLIQARLDVVGVFGYSDEDGTDAAGFEDKLAPDVINARVERVTALAEELMSQRAEDRIGTRVDVLVEEVGDEIIGRAAHQGPEVDGTTRLVGATDTIRRGQFVAATVLDAEGIDLVATVDTPPW
jgi:ribosomal protein S12 methylthiotransferase